MYKISKQFECSYSHRVYTQVIYPDLSGGEKTHCPCKVCHGHNSTITVELEGEELNDQGMLVDYVNLTFFKKFVDKELDHKTILGLDDPWTIDFINSGREYKDYILNWDKSNLLPQTVNEMVFYYKVKTPSIRDYHHDITNGLVLVKFVPTSENLCKWMHEIVSAKLAGICKVSSVSFSETPKTLATYLG